MKKFIVIVLGCLSAFGFLLMLGAEHAEHWARMLVVGFGIFAGSILLIDIVKDPRKYYRHFIGLSAIIVAVKFRVSGHGGRTGRALHDIRINTGSYLRVGRYIADAAYYSDVRLEDYCK